MSAFSIPENEFTKPGSPGIPTIPRRWGESADAYRQRLMEFQAPYQIAAQERKMVEAEALKQEGKSRSILGEQTDIQKKRLAELTTLLAGQQKTQFNQDIPGIAETAQGAGMLETSGFGNALANRYKELTANTSAELARQSLTDRDLEIGELGKIGAGANNLSTAGLERQFSSSDLARSETLARELARYGVPAPAKEPSSFEKILPYAGPVLSGVGAMK